MGLQETIDSIKKDFTEVKDFSREDLLALCAKNRIEEINHNYECEFDRLLVSLEKDCMNGADFDKLSASMNSLSSILTVLYDTLLNHINFYKGDQS